MTAPTQRAADVAREIAAGVEWRSFACQFGWSLYGWAGNDRATFVTDDGILLQINASQRTAITAALAAPPAADALPPLVASIIQSVQEAADAKETGLADDREADLALARELVRLANNAVTMGADSTARWTNATRPALRGAAKTIERLHRTLAARPDDAAAGDAETIAELRRELRDVNDAAALSHKCGVKLLERSVRGERVLEPILKYTTHLYTCRYNGGHDCDCGLDEIRAAIKGLTP